MMTCVSLGSGMASRATRCMDHQPATQAASTKAKTTTLFSTEKSMMRLIMGASDRSGRVTGSFGIEEFLEVVLRFLVEFALAAVGAEVVGVATVCGFPASSRGLALVGHHAADRTLDGHSVAPGGCSAQTALTIHNEVAAHNHMLA